ncbi:MAG: O-antigen ligase family protein [Burkholderiaceae bacterium]|nr:O-antigen ligase family protein [Burkholderiaceae bacterium]
MSKEYIFKESCASVGFAITLLISLIVVFNQLESLKALDPYYRITIPALCLAFSFIISTINLRWGIIACAFALPLLPNLAWQIQQHFGYGRILSLHNSGLDLVAGLFLGGLTNRWLKNKQISVKDAFPWQLGLLMLVLTASVSLAIARNLHQTASPFQLSSLLYNLMHLRSIGWHDDYRPLVDWVVFGCASSIIYVIVSALASSHNRNEYIFKPLIISFLIAAYVGFKQSKYGFGLSLDQINFRVDRFGYMALGFQHDIHAFAGQMLIGAIGLWGYLYYAKSIQSKLLILSCIPVFWVALFLSKSKSNFTIAVIALFFIFSIWLFKRSRLILPVLKPTIYVVVIVIFSMVFFHDVWISSLTKLTHYFGLPDLKTINFKLSYRPEVYLAALKFFALYPILGLGQSEFYRQSADHTQTNSYYLSINQNGENAHNYFLQTLAETGLVGIAVYCLLIFYPIFRIKNKRALIPVGVALGALFFGNIFAHSMLVRENLFIAACFIGLMYACMKGEQTSVVTTDFHSKSKEQKYSASSAKVKLLSHPYLIATFAIVVMVSALREIYISFRSVPFLKDVQCFKERKLDADGWTSGVFNVAIPQGAKGITFNIKGTQPYVSKRPLAADLNIMHGESRRIQSSQILFSRDGFYQVSINFDKDAVADDEKYRAELRLERCFIPRNLNINEDGRRLGIQIESTTVNY